MFTLLRYLVSSLFVLVFGIFAGCSDSDGFDARQLESDTYEAYEIVLSDDFDRLAASGVVIDSTNGIFSIGWNQFFNPMTNDTLTHGHAFAVVSDTVNSPRPRPMRNGIDIGSVFINYQSNHIELQKIVHPAGGVLYTLFSRPMFGNVLGFVPGEIYEFEVTGSSTFGAVNIPLTAPPALLDFTSHANGDVIDPNTDLTLTWSGGVADDPVAIHILPDVMFQPLIGGGQVVGNYNIGPGYRSGPGFRPGGRPGPMPHPLPLPLPVHAGIFEVLPNNPGQYTVSAADLQNLLNGTNATGIICHISQIDAAEVQHEGRILRAVMRNGDRLRLGVQ